MSVAISGLPAVKANIMAVDGQVPFLLGHTPQASQWRQRIGSPIALYVADRPHTQAITWSRPGYACAYRRDGCPRMGVWSRFPFSLRIAVCNKLIFGIAARRGAESLGSSSSSGREGVEVNRTKPRIWWNSNLPLRVCGRAAPKIAPVRNSFRMEVRDIKRYSTRCQWMTHCGRPVSDPAFRASRSLSSVVAAFAAIQAGSAELGANLFLAAWPVGFGAGEIPYELAPRQGVGARGGKPYRSWLFGQSMVEDAKKLASRAMS